MSREPTRKRPPCCLFALGGAHLPAAVTAGGTAYRFVRLFKHDFFAATGLYERVGADPRGVVPPGEDATLVVLKIQRTYPFLGLPVRWLGRQVARHEIDIYRRLQGVAGVPTFLGAVGTTGFLHAFVPGCELSAERALAPEFFEQLGRLLSALHARGIAYVDTNKRENILHGGDGRPWLIDFQISFACRRHPSRNPLARWLLGRLQAEDWYHFYKHKIRLAPAACSPEEVARGARQSAFIRIHRLIAQPLIRTRRRFLARYELEKGK